jgi:hypothetical protein
MKRPKENLIAGIDLHSNNLVIGVINQDGKRLEHRKLDCDLKQVVDFFKPLKSRLQSLAVPAHKHLRLSARSAADLYPSIYTFLAVVTLPSTISKQLPPLRCTLASDEYFGLTRSELILRHNSKGH